MSLSRTQKILRFFTSEKIFEEIMDESSRYKFYCEHCGRQSNIWKIGGIRYKAYENQPRWLNARTAAGLPCERSAKNYRVPIIQQHRLYEKHR